ncbi:MAG: TolC family protein [Planctomycetes bacterium]|nr:TolC family protein [Planctomycetota bacterium]
MSRRAIAFIVLALAAGCGRPWPMDRLDVDVDPARLQTIEPVTAEALAAPDAPPAPAPPAAALELTLQQARADALANNLQLEVALLAPAIAAAQVTEAEALFESILFGQAAYVSTEAPTVTDPTTSREEAITAEAGISVPLRTGGQATLSVPTGRSDIDPAYQADVAFGITQPLLRGAGLWTNAYPIRIARGDWQVSLARTRLEVIRVLAEVDRVYWRLFAARRELDVRRRELELAEAQLQRARRQVEVGMAAEIEILRAQAGAAERVEAVIVAENLVRLRQRDLKRLLNRPDLELTGPTAVVPVTDPVVMPVDPQPSRLTEVALERRMEMLELEIRIAQDASTIDLARNAALPVLALDYQYNLNGLGDRLGDAFDMIGRGDFQSHRAGLVLEVPLGNQAAQSRLRRAVLERLGRLATRRRQADQIRQEVHDATDALLAAWQRVLAAGEQVALAERVVAAEQRQFDLGLRTSTDVLDAQARLAAARSAEIRAVTDYQIALVDIAYATGTLLGWARVHWEPGP